MGIFKEEELAKKFFDLRDVVILKLNKCGNCKRLNNCHLLKSLKEKVLESGDLVAKNFVMNFLVYYVAMNEATAKYFNMNISDIVRQKQ